MTAQQRRRILNFASRINVNFLPGYRFGSFRRNDSTPRVIVGSYHKTGTVWLRAIFRDIAFATGRGWIDLSDDYIEKPEEMISAIYNSCPGAIIFEHHTAFPKLELKSSFKGFRMVRDPRDIVISAERYHRRSDETWLHIPMEKFFGRTYQEALNAIEDPLEAIRFELENSSGRIISKMLSFENSHCLKTIKYEEMMVDDMMMQWMRLMAELGFRGKELPACLNAVWRNSLFGEKGKENKHVTDGSVAQWRKKFTSEMRDVFARAFPNACEFLGYSD